MTTSAQILNMRRPRRWHAKLLSEYRDNLWLPLYANDEEQAMREARRHLRPRDGEKIELTELLEVG